MKGMRSAVVAVVAAVALAGCSSTDSAPTESDKQADATSSCHKWVKEKLKAPATAEFSGDNVTGTGGDYTIVGNVDSENSFGANIRSVWMCTIKLDGDTWRGNVTVG